MSDRITLQAAVRQHNITANKDFRVHLKEKHGLKSKKDLGTGHPTYDPDELELAFKACEIAAHGQFRRLMSPPAKRGARRTNPKYELVPGPKKESAPTPTERVKTLLAASATLRQLDIFARIAITNQLSVLANTLPTLGSDLTRNSIQVA